MGASRKGMPLFLFRILQDVLIFPSCVPIIFQPFRHVEKNIRHVVKNTSHVF